MKVRSYLFAFTAILCSLFALFFIVDEGPIAIAGNLVCVVTSTCSSGVVILRMASTTNSHAELPTQSNYANLVCCSGPIGLGNSCAASVHSVVVNLASTTNSHVEEGTLSNYLTQACLSLPSGTTTIKYTSTSSCTGFDTTLFSISSSTNAHVAKPGTSTFQAGATIQVCGTASSSGFVLPAVSSVVLNHGSAITLTPNATTSITVNATVTDAGGCSNITGGTPTILMYRSGVSSSTCLNSPNNLNCYVASAFTASSTCSANAVNTTTTFGVYYYAQPTDASSSFSAQNWIGTVMFADSTSATGTADSPGQELNTLTAIALSSSSLGYGNVPVGQNTGSTNQILNIVNAGNSSTTMQVSGTALASGGNFIATSSQHYATSSFTYGGAEQALSNTATTITGVNIPPVTGAIYNAWKTTNLLLYGAYGGGAAANNGYMYFAGGNVNTVPTQAATTSFAVINTDGSLGAWAATTPLPAPLQNNALLANNGFLYNLGGDSSSSNPTSSVFFAPINATGSIGAWATTTKMLYGDSSFGSAIYNGFMYVTAGSASGTRSSTVSFAPINATGSLGAWATTTPMLYTATQNFSVAYNGFLYTLGGFASSSQTSTVSFAPINATGSLGAWATTTPMLYNNQAFGAAAYNGNMYVVGGFDAGFGDTTTVLYAPIYTNGTLGTWTSTKATPNAIDTFSFVSNNGYFYELGGNVFASPAASSVYYTSLSAVPTYWGISLASGTVGGAYTGTLTYTAVYSP